MRVTARIGVLFLLNGSLAACALEDPNALRRGSGIKESAAAPEGDVTAAAEEAGRPDVDGDPVFEGDIVLPESDLQGIASTATAIAHWPSGVIPYEVDPTIADLGRFTSAVNHWHLKTGIRFIERTTEVDYVRVIADIGCYSYVGRVGGPQKLSIGTDCNVGQIVHEIGHAVGLWHEHSRSDRDNHIQIHLENVMQGQGQQFAKTAFTSIGSYDVGSIMQFGSTFFSKDGRSFTMTKKDGSPVVPNRSALSDKDVAGIAQLYEAEVLAVPDEKAPGGNVAKTSDAVNLRTGPSTNDDVILVIPAGSTVLLTGKSQNGFLSVSYADKTGWLYGQYIAGNQTSTSSSSTQPKKSPPKKKGVDHFVLVK
ncbi:MAG TPA: M12 family metallopeptidase [Labilithrix sp.]|nr:M12 family metallopeptidase [Labilithrix sp.]